MKAMSVAHQDGDALARRHAERSKARRDAPHPAVEVGLADAAAAR
jgi:hypothetical protein